jgi:hypothetical protein
LTVFKAIFSCFRANLPRETIRGAGAPHPLQNHSVGSSHAPDPGFGLNDPNDYQYMKLYNGGKTGIVKQ